MQTKADLEAWYNTPDPWNYVKTDDDAVRKQRILDALEPFGKFSRALDIGSGEGFITKDLPAHRIEAIEISDQAAARLPKRIIRTPEPTGGYDLITCTGMLYQQYDYQQFIDWINDHATGIVLTSNIKEWERNMLPANKQIHYEEFPYREFTQALRVYDYALTP